MAENLFLLPFRPALDPNGLTISGAKLYFYLSGTSTLTSVFADDGLTVELTNPVTANSAGVWPDIYYDPAIVMRVVLKDEDDVSLADVDPYTPGLVDPVNAATQALLAAAAAQAALAQAAAQGATSDAAAATAAASIILGAGAPYHFFDTKAAAVAAAAGLPDGYAYVWADETQGGDFTVYSVASGSLSGVPVANLTPDLGYTGTLAAQNADDVTITGGSITQTVVQPFAGTAAALAALAVGGDLTIYALYVDTTNNLLKLATSASALIDIGPYTGSSDPWVYSKLASNFTGTSATLTDTGIALAAASFDTNSIYEVEASLLVKVASGQFQIGVTPPGNADGAYTLRYPYLFRLDNSDAAAYNQFTTAYETPGILTTTWALVALRGILTTSGTTPTGSLKFQVRNSYGGATHTVSRGSFLKIRKLN